MDRTQKVGKKNGVICLVIMFTSGVMVVEMSKMAHFLYFLLTSAKNQSQLGLFSADDSKKTVPVWRKYLSASERLYLALSENVIDYWILSIH